MPKPLVMPSVTLRRVEGYSLEALKTRLGGSKIVRVGLPDNETTEQGNVQRDARKPAQTPKGTP